MGSMPGFSEMLMTAIRSGFNPALLARSSMAMGEAKEMSDKQGADGSSLMLLEEEVEAEPEAQRVAVDPKMAAAKRKMHALHGTDIRGLMKLSAPSARGPGPLSRGLSAA